MNEYTIILNGAEIEEWSAEFGCVDIRNRWSKDVHLERTVQLDHLTRVDILEVIKDMLYHDGELSENDLFDGNETYFIFSRLENGESEELEEGKNGYLVSYFVNVEARKPINAIEII